MTASALTIAFVPGVSPAKWARVWRERFPDVELVLRPIGADGVDDALAGNVDMVFARLPMSDEHHAIPLWTETAVVAMPKDADLAALDEVTTTDLADVTVLGSGPVPEDVDAALDLVEANVGVVVLPQSLFRAASRKPLVARPLLDAPGTRIALVWRDADASGLTEDFIGVVRGRTANSSRGGTSGESSPAATSAAAPSRAGSSSSSPRTGGPARAGRGGGRPSRPGSAGRGRGKSGRKGRR